MGSRTGGKENPAVRAKYVEWMKVPKDMRAEMARAYKERGEVFPTTKDEFRQVHNVNRATLWRWEQDPDFKREVANEALGLITADELTAMIDVQKQKALAGDLKAFEAIMRFAKLEDVGTKMPDDDEDFSKYSDEELEAMFGDEWNE